MCRCIGSDKVNKNVFYISLIIIFGIKNTASAETLNTELLILKKEHPQIMSFQSQLSASQEGVKAAFSAYLPRVDFTSDAGQEKVSNPALRSTTEGPPTLGSETWGLTVTQNVYDGGLKSAVRSVSKLTENTIAHTLSSITQAVLFEGVTSYVDVLRQTKLVELSTRNADNIRKQLDLEDARVRRGAGIAVDVLSAKSRLQLAEERLVFVNGGLINSISRYRQVFGHMPSPEKMQLTNLKFSLIPKTRIDAIAIALAENPAVLMSGSQIDIASKSRKTVKAEYFPNVNIIFDGGYESDFSGLPGIKRDYAVRAQASWNLFNGLNTKYRDRQAAHDIEARRRDHEQTIRKVEEQTKFSWQALKTTQRREELLENAVNIASEVFESRKKLREAGKETVINVLDSENALFNAEINYIGARFDANLAAYQLLLSMGRLTAQSAIQ
jgi:adhesin transport system outer membrane protein